MLRSGLSAAAAGLAAVCVSSPAFGETLQEALAITYQSNPQLLAERARLRVAPGAALFAAEPCGTMARRRSSPEELKQAVGFFPVIARGDVKWLGKPPGRRSGQKPKLAGRNRNR